MLQMGAMNRVYDKVAFPIPEDEIADWQAINEKTGKATDMPRQVYALRMWDPSVMTYTPVEPLLDGAPATDEALSAYWKTTLADITTAWGKDFGESFIPDLIRGEEWI